MLKLKGLQQFIILIVTDTFSYKENILLIVNWLDIKSSSSVYTLNIIYNLQQLYLIFKNLENLLVILFVVIKYID